LELETFTLPEYDQCWKQKEGTQVWRMDDLVEALNDSFTSHNQSWDNPVAVQSEQHREQRDVLKEFMKTDEIEETLSSTFVL
jgi:hypothetical protein